MRTDRKPEIPDLTGYPPCLYGCGHDVALLVRLTAQHVGKSRLRILDVGGYEPYPALRERTLLGDFLPDHEVITLDRRACYAPRYIRGEIARLPFRAGAVDLAVMRHGLEGVSAEEWGMFREDLVRVAVYGIIIAEPLSSGQKSLVEQILREYGRVTGATAEAEAFSRETTSGCGVGECFAASAGLPWISLDGGSLEEQAEREMVRIYLRSLPGAAQLLGKLDRYFNLNYKSSVCSGEALRRYFIFGIGFAPEELRSGWNADCAGQPGKTELPGLSDSPPPPESMMEKGINLSHRNRGHLEGLRLLLELDGLGMRRRLDEQNQEIARLKSQLAEHRRRTLTRVYRFLEFFQLHVYAPPVRFFRGALGKAGQLLLALRGRRRHPWLSICRRAYARWIVRTEPSAQQLEQFRKKCSDWTGRPLFSIVAPVFNTDPRWIEKAAESALQQVYPHWELILVNDGSTHDDVAVTLNRLRLRDERIRVRHLPENQGIAGASNFGLEMARGDFIAFMDSDDELHPAALYEVANLLQQYPDAGVVFSDEDKLTTEGTREKPEFKPGWNAEYFLTYNYINHLTVIRKQLIDAVGGFRPEYNWSQDYDLFLRVTEQTEKIYHIPRILYHWRAIPGSSAARVDTRPLAQEKCREILEEMLARRGLRGKVKNGLRPGTFSVRIQGPRTEKPRRGHGE